MESNTSDRSSITRCELCNEPGKEIKDYTWPFYEIVITRKLCTECFYKINEKIQTYKSHIRITTHSYFKKWEREERKKIIMNRRQQTLPGV